MLSRNVLGIRNSSLARSSAAAALTMMVAACGGDRAPAPNHTAPSPLPVRFNVPGIVREAGTMRFLSGARVVVASGPDAGAFAISDAGGAFTLPNLLPGAIDVEGSKDGYLVARLENINIAQDMTLDVPLYATPPRDRSGATAMARCKDASWSWAEAQLACRNNGGVATAYLRAPRRGPGIKPLISVGLHGEIER